MLFRQTRGGWLCVLLAILVLGDSRAAFAYIDPGVGSMAYQSLVGLLLGGVVFMRHIWMRIRGGTGGTGSSHKPTGPAPPIDEV